jgi:hypothetical protein
MLQEPHLSNDVFVLVFCSRGQFALRFGHVNSPSADNRTRAVCAVAGARALPGAALFVSGATFAAAAMRQFNRTPLLSDGRHHEPRCPRVQVNLAVLGFTVSTKPCTRRFIPNCFPAAREVPRCATEYGEVPLRARWA